MAQADALFSAESFKHALEKVPAGTFNRATVTAMQARADQAAKEGVPVLVCLGNTKFFGVRDGHTFNRTVVREVAHVKYDESAIKMIQCKVGDC